MLAHLQWCISLLTMAEFQECLTSVFFIFFDKQAMAKKKKTGRRKPPWRSSFLNTYRVLAEEETIIILTLSPI